MKKIIFALLAIFLLGAFSAPKHKPGIKCLKQSGKFVVDGKSSDWEIDSLQFDSKTGFAYSFSNDNRFFYVQLKMLDVNVQRKALITGLTLWIDPNGKGKHVLGIEYPQGRKPGQYNRKPGQRPSGQQRPAANGQISKEQLRMFNERYRSEIPKFKGFDKAGINAFAGNDGVNVLMQMDTLGHVIYEAQIPLTMLFGQPADFLSKDKPFSVQFETGYLQMDMSQMKGRGGMGGGRGMGGGQRPDPSRMAFMQSMAEPSRLKIKSVHLFQGK